MLVSLVLMHMTCIWVVSGSSFSQGASYHGFPEPFQEIVMILP